MPKGVIRAVSFLGVMVLLPALPLGHALAASDDAPDHAIIPGLENHKDLDPAMAGLILLGELNCASCHDAGAKANLINTKAAPDLSSVGQRINPKYLAKFIADPTATKPGTTMPNVMAKLNANQRSAAANAITHYLASLSKESFDRDTATSKVDPKAAPRGNDEFFTTSVDRLYHDSSFSNHSRSKIQVFAIPAPDGAPHALFKSKSAEYL